MSIKLKKTAFFPSLKTRLKINFFDFFLFGIVIFAGLIFYFVFRRETATIQIRLKVTDKDVLYQYANPNNSYASAFKVGDSELNEIGQKTAEIVGVEAYNISATDQVVYLDVDVKAVYNPLKKQYTMKGKPVIFGESFVFSFSKVYVQALVVDFPGSNFNQDIQIGKTIVKTQVRFDSRQFSDVYGAPKFYLAAIHQGDEMKDSHGNVLAKILNVDSSPAKRVVITANGILQEMNDPELVDIFLTVELTTKRINGKTYMFDYLPLQVGSSVPLNLSTIAIYPIITEIQQ